MLASERIQVYIRAVFLWLLPLFSKGEGQTEVRIALDYLKHLKVFPITRRVYLFTSHWRNYNADFFYLSKNSFYIVLMSE